MTSHFQKSSNNHLEKNAKKRALFQYTVTILGFLLIAVLLGGAGTFFWLQRQKSELPLPNYTNSDKESPDYWKERAQFDIDFSRNDKDAGSVNLEKLRFFTARTLNEAQQIDSNYARVMALSDVALTLAKNDISLNIDEQLKFLANSPIGLVMQARICISQALMELRKGNRSQARVLIQQYSRLVIDQDLKLGNDMNEMSFSGAVTVLAVLEDTTLLTKIFDEQIAFSFRLPDAQRMRAFRFIAGEQARIEMSVYAMNTVTKIKGALETARAYQQIIAFTARPQKTEPVEPVPFLPQTTGPWKPSQSRAVVQQIILNVVQQIAGQEELDTQIDILTRLAGSRLMCDPMIYPLFREAVDNYKGLDSLVKRPVLELLDNPESALIRASLGMPPLPQDKVKNIDPALDDWQSSIETISVALSNLDPEILKTINAQQTIRLHYMTAQCYLMVNRHQDAARILQNAFSLAKSLPDKTDQVTNLMRLGEKQLTAKDFSGAKTSFLAAGLPGTPPSASEQAIYSVDTLSSIARLQIAGRFFDDAIKTIACISIPAVRDGDYVFLIKEYIRINRLIDAERLIAQISDAAIQKEMQPILGIAKEGTAEHYKALNIPYPAEIQDINVLKRVCERLIPLGLFNAAAQTAEKITDAEIRSAYQARIIQEYLFLLRVYGEESEPHRGIRKGLFDQAERIARRIENPFKRTEALETLIAAVLPHRKEDQMQQKLNELLTESFTTVQQGSLPPEEKGNVMARLILSKIMLESSEDSTAVPPVPLIDRVKNPEQYNEIMKLIDDTVTMVNDMDDAPKRGYTIAFLSKALGQIGRTNASLSMLEDAEESAAEFSDAKDAVSLLLSLVPAYKSLNKADDVQRVYRIACNVVLESYTAVGTDEVVMEWRTRDSELERIIRSQFEQNYVADAILFADRINEPLLKDRLLRTAAYIYVDKNEAEYAEFIARRIKLDLVRGGTIRDVLFARRSLKRQNSEVQPSANVVSPEPVNEELQEEQEKMQLTEPVPQPTVSSEIVQ